MPNEVLPSLTKEQIDLPRDRVSTVDVATSSSSLTLDILTPVAKRQRSVSPSSHLGNSGGPVCWDAYLSRCGAAVGQPSLRAIVNRFSGVPGSIGLHAGLPAPEAFPITRMSCTLRDGTEVTIDNPETLAAMQQYSIAPMGHPPLAKWATEHTQHQHNPPAATSTAITIGSNAALEMLCMLLLEPGDGVLTEQYSYSHLVEHTLKLHGNHAVPVAMDALGVQPNALRAVLQAARAAGGRQPRVFYTVPTGQNPTGSTVPADRKWEIYTICSEFGIIIIEDDPYYYLQYPDAAGVRGLDRLERSYLSLDTEGRVVRLDSFAKFLAPGLRLGWATGAPTIVEKLAHCVAGTSLGASSTSQVLVLEMLKAWGDAGLRNHVEDMQRSYARRATVTVAAADKHLEGLASWRAPQAGMFLWVALGAGVSDADEILDLLAEHRVVVVPGRICHSLGPRPPRPCPFVRISFSLVPEEQLAEAMCRLGGVLRAFAKTRPLAVAPPAAAAAEVAAAGEPVPPGAALA